MDFLRLFKERIFKFRNRALTNRILNMKIMFCHINVSMANQTLDGSKVNTQSLHLRNIRMSAAMGSENSNTFN